MKINNKRIHRNKVMRGLKIVKRIDYMKRITHGWTVVNGRVTPCKCVRMLRSRPTCWNRVSKMFVDIHMRKKLTAIVYSRTKYRI